MTALGISTSAIALPKDEDGFYISPTCDELRIIQGSLKLQNLVSTGLTSSNDKWDMELYQSEAGKWSLLGKSKAPPSKYEAACILEVGASDFKAKRWYELYFEKNARSGE
ncbi:hypothetical protein D3C76_1562240 [compost metagenome]